MVNVLRRTKTSLKRVKDGPKGGVSKKIFFFGKYYNCDKVDNRLSECRLLKRNNNKEANVVDDIANNVFEMSYRSSECRLLKRNNNKEANVVDDIANNVSEMSLVAIISEVNLVDSNSRE
ncbi:zinc finger protein [Abeliophyllum distichum]|uniref:Zinc finger protein n=1 Tax=Abeliophyllum distichum TaxID=126358 RepID=A0ABD1RFJ6_9LAMI